MVRRSPSDSGIGTIEPVRLKVQLRDKRIDGAYRIIFPDIVIETLRQKVNLGSIRSVEEAAHPNLVDSLLDYSRSQPRRIAEAGVVS